MTKKKVDELVTQMRRDGIPAMGMHGDKEQRERDYVLAEFKRGTSPFLVATDVASRGLDVKDIQFVINYDYPGTRGATLPPPFPTPSTIHFGFCWGVICFVHLERILMGSDPPLLAPKYGLLRTKHPTSGLSICVSHST